MYQPLNEINFFVNSSTASGAKNKSPDGSQFQVFLENPIAIPSDATNCSLIMQESNIWYTFPNVITSSNDAFSIDDGVLGPYTFQLAQGLYDLSSLDSAINVGIVNAGGPANLITLLADTATQKVIIQVNLIGTTVLNTVANSVMVSLCGFAAADIGPTVANPEFFTATNQATLNQVNSVLVHTDLIDGGMRLNNTYDQIIANSPLNDYPGSLIYYQPYRPPKIDASNLIGAKRSTFKIWLTDENRNTINTGGEDFQIRFAITWT